MEPRRRSQRAAVLSRRAAIGAGLLALVALAAVPVIPGAAQELEPARRHRVAEPYSGSEPPLGSDPIPALPLPGRTADPGRLAEARSLFAAPPRESRLGPYFLMTDVEDRDLLASMVGVTEQIEPLYRSRYGLDLAGEAAETVVLYRSERAYRVLQGRSERIRGLASRGHVGWGMVVLYAGRDSNGNGLLTVLGHELGHVLNRRGLGPALPPWLDEGLADDLAAHELGPQGEARETPLEAMRAIDGDTIEIRGALANLDLLAKALDAATPPTLSSILALDWTRFMEEPRATLHYAASAWLVRYLLDPRSGLTGEFRAFLGEVARGGTGEPADLDAALGRPWPELEAGWRAYVAERALEAGVGPAAAFSSRASGSSSRHRDSPSA